MPALEFDGSLFNIEFFVGADGRPRIVEVNGRMASQFAPLVRAVHGVSTYELQLELACGGRPELPPARDGVVAASFLLRTYEDAIVRAAPDPATVYEALPGAHVELLVRVGQRLSENDDDVRSTVSPWSPCPAPTAQRCSPLRGGARADAVRARPATGTGLGALAPCPPDRRAYACQPWPSKPTETTRPSSTTVGTMRVPSV